MTPLIILSFVSGFLDRENLGRLFFITCCVYVASLSLKPFGISPDDYNYSVILKQGCIDLPCLPFGRDFIWINIVTLGKLTDSFVFVVIFACAALSLKLFVLFKLSHFNYIGLFLYLCYSMHLFDFTQYRAGLALTFSFLAYYCIVRFKKIRAIALTSLAMGSHLIGFISLLQFVKIPHTKIILLTFIILSLGFFYFLQTAPVVNLDIFSHFSFIFRYQEGALSGKFEESGVLGFGYFICIFIFAVVCSVPSKKNAKYLLPLVALGLFQYPLLSFIPVISSRVLEFTFSFICLTIGQLKIGQYRRILLSLCSLLLFFRSHYNGYYFLEI